MRVEEEVVASRSSLQVEWLGRDVVGYWKGELVDEKTLKVDGRQRTASGLDKKREARKTG